MLVVESHQHTINTHASVRVKGEAYQKRGNTPLSVVSAQRQRASGTETEETRTARGTE